MAKLKFNTQFLLKAIAVSSVGCLPAALIQPEGVFISACAVPLSIAWLACTQVRRHGEYRIELEKSNDNLYELRTDGGRQGEVIIHGRILGVGVLLSIVGLVLANGQATLEWDGVWSFWLVIVLLLFFGTAISLKRFVDIGNRLVVTRFMLFDAIYCMRLKWQIIDDDYLAVFVKQLSDDGSKPEFEYLHTLYICRGRHRRILASGFFNQSRALAGMDAAGEKLASTLKIPYRGYLLSKGFWWTT